MMETSEHTESSDPLFTEPYVDIDEWRDEPVRHRYVHGGFKGTDTRFSIYFPPKEQYEGRFFQYIQPISGDENVAHTPGPYTSSYSMDFAIDSGGYLVISNLGRMDMFTGDDPTIGGYRTSAAVAKYSRVLASEMYGDHRPYGYAWGGSGGAYKTISCIENTDGVWDGVVPFVHATPISIPYNFSVQAHAMRVLEDKMPAIVDAVEPGGSGDMYADLNEEERAALTEVTKMGFPPSAWFHYRMIAFGYTGVLTTLFDQIIKTDPTYVEDFWKVPGYLGADPPESLQRRRINHETTISKLLMPSDLREMGIPVAYSADAASDIEPPAAFIMENLPEGDLQGASIFLRSGDAEGCVLYIAGAFDNMVMIAFGQDNFRRLVDIKVGDKVEIDNSVYLAFQTYHRHQDPPPEYYVFDQFRDADGNPLYPQRPEEFRAETGAGSIQTGRFTGKMIVVQNIMDEIAYAWQADWYRTKVKAALGEQFDDNYRLWFIDRALHTPPVVTPLDSPPVVTTRVINYGGVLQQALRDVSAWVEKGVAPPMSTPYEVVDGQVQVPPTAAERKGVQPLVTVEVNGGVRADVKAGKKVKFSAVIEAPPDAGSIVGVEWDFEGDGDFPVVQKLKDTKSDRVKVKTTYAFSEGGTYFPALRATLHRQGDSQTPYARVQNIGRVRVVVEADKKKGAGKELVIELKKTPDDFQKFMDEFVEKMVQHVTVMQGTEISSVEVGPRTNRSTKFQITPFVGEAFYTISFEDVDAGIGVFLELNIEVTGAYKLAKKAIQKATSKSIAENVIKTLDEILEETE
ncbi:MAG: hypothetical protein ThorAB25_25220 [Candidatus Thorarchaeota archaeon AB_25]|nr:MAG: hypothetical protein ThorAB25_25220 [Candidatus Thorarchaeota archaeon AB_25]